MMSFLLFIYIKPFLSILAIGFFNCHYLPFPFPKGYRLKKGHIVPLLCSLSLKKEKEQKRKEIHQPLGAPSEGVVAGLQSFLSGSPTRILVCLL